MSTRDRKSQNKTNKEEVTEVEVEDVNTEMVEEAVVEEVTAMTEPVEAVASKSVEEDKALIKPANETSLLEEIKPVTTVVDKGQTAKPLKDKSSDSNKNARKKALKLAQAKADMEARLFQIYQQLEIDPSVGNPVIIGICSSLRGEGRTTVALAMATVLANSMPYPVLLISADVSQPHGFIPEESEAKNDLCRYLRGETSWEDLAFPTAITDLWIVPPGDSNNQPQKLLRSKRLEEVFAELKLNFGVVIVDMPPMVLSAEFGRVVELLDKLVFVIEAGSTPRKLIKSNLEFVQDKLGGVILNQVKPTGPGFLRKIFNF
jgi:Mrp family chromosome partitioning ATPase